MVRMISFWNVRTFPTAHGMNLCHICFWWNWARSIYFNICCLIWLPCLWNLNLLRSPGIRVLATRMQMPPQPGSGLGLYIPEFWHATWRAKHVTARPLSGAQRQDSNSVGAYYMHTHTHTILCGALCIAPELSLSLSLSMYVHIFILYI